MTFSQTLRSLQAERSSFAPLWLLVVSAILLAWLLWFFLSSVAIRTYGEIIHTTSSGVVTAEFPRAAQNDIQLGQAALLQPTAQTTDASVAASAPIPATVTEIVMPAQTDRLRVTLFADMDSPNAAAIQADLTGRVEIVVAHLSPATLVLNGTQSKE